MFRTRSTDNSPFYSKTESISIYDGQDVDFVFFYCPQSCIAHPTLPSLPSYLAIEPLATLQYSFEPDLPRFVD